jgi:hypothetical protein
LQANEIFDDQYRFHTTRWSVVVLSAQSHVPGFQAALSALQNLPVSAVCLCATPRLRSRRSPGSNPGFFLHLLEHKTLGRADSLRGKFRSFLLGSLQNYLLTAAERARALKRGGGVEFVSLDLQDAENRYRLEAVDALPPKRCLPPAGPQRCSAKQ